MGHGVGPRMTHCVCLCRVVVVHSHDMQGWEKYPWLRILSWEAQWLEYTIELFVFGVVAAVSAKGAQDDDSCPCVGVRAGTTI